MRHFPRTARDTIWKVEVVSAHKNMRRVVRMGPALTIITRMLCLQLMWPRRSIFDRLPVGDRVWRRCARKILLLWHASLIACSPDLKDVFFKYSKDNPNRFFHVQINSSIRKYVCTPIFDYVRFQFFLAPPGRTDFFVLQLSIGITHPILCEVRGYFVNLGWNHRKGTALDFHDCGWDKKIVQWGKT